jgi:hypothetical protein
VQKRNQRADSFGVIVYFYRGETVTFSRRDLYKMVWKTSAVQLAKELGISDVAIAKLCKKHRIPKPSLGYWARIKHGQKVPRAALPKVAEDLDVVRFHRCQPPEDQEMKNPEALAMVAAEKDTANQIVVADQLTNPHELIERTAKSLSTAAADERGIAQPKAKRCLDVAVSKGTLDRAMRIMDALVKALEARGFPVSVTDDEAKGRATVVTVLGEPLKIGLSEKTDCKKRPPTAEQLARQAKYSWAYPPTIYDYTPSGKLKLSILTGGYDNLRRNWSDLVHQRVENCLNRFTAALVKVAEREKADRLEAERREREWQEETRRREEEERRVAEEKARIEDLDAKALAWRKSQRLREYIAAIESAATQKLGQIDPESDYGRWRSWAKSHADQVDPIDAVLQKFAQSNGGQDEGDGVEDD